MSKTNHPFIILLPVLNEGENIRTICAQIEALNLNVAIVFVVTTLNAQDNTDIEIINSLQTENPNIYFLANQQRGLGIALKQGMKHIQDNFDYQHLITMDADGSHDPSIIPGLLRAGHGVDLIIASRYVPGGLTTDWPRSRNWGSILVNKLFANICQTKTCDLTSGFRIYSHQAITKINLSEMKSRGYVWQIEMLYRFIQAGCSIMESPMTFKNRQVGKSKLKLNDILEYLRLFPGISGKK